MKKIYLQPTTSLVKIKMQPLLQFASNGDRTLRGGGSKGDLSDGDEVLSRRNRTFWEDEE